MFFIFQGLEFDWEWPLSTGDKKDKIKLIRYMRVTHFQKLSFSLTSVSLTHSVTDNVTNSSMGLISVVCESIWTFFTICHS